MVKKNKSDAEKRQARKEALEKMAHGSLVNKVLAFEEKEELSKKREQSYQREIESLDKNLKEMVEKKRLLERRLKLYGVKPTRIMIEYFKEQVDQPDGYTLEETEAEGVGIVCEPIEALSWEVYSGRLEWEPSGIHLIGIDSEYMEFDYSDVVAYTTPDGRRYTFEDDEEKEG